LTRERVPRPSMFDIGSYIYGLFGSGGEAGVILCIFLIFLVDALVFPTLPELFIVICFMYEPEPNLVFGAELLGAAVAAEIVGIMTLWYIVGHIRVPKRISDLADRYTGFLILGDERLLLVNRVAPMIPFAGAFIRIAGWDIKKSMVYVIIGCVLKYGLILLMSDFFFVYFSSSEAQIFTLIFVLIVIVVSFLLSFIAKKNNGLNKNEKDT
jgi:hypothetical protein